MRRLASAAAPRKTYGVAERVWQFALYAVSSAALLAVVVGGAAYWAWRDLSTPAPLPPGGAVVSVAPGEAFRVTSVRLQAAGVIQHAWTLRLWAQWQGLDRFVRNGDYRFDQPLPPLAVLAMLRSPTAALHRVTIPEGSTVHDVASLLAAAGFGGIDQFLCWTQDADLLLDLDLPSSGFEGYLFPDTYAFAWSTPPERILRTLVERFHERTGRLQERRKQIGMNQSDMVILASIIEKETGAAQERPLISAVFHNRLRLGMPLQSDPTAVYGRDDRSAPTAADLTLESPYNTYLHRGLPPGPICNPGLAALEAAITPDSSQYLYFVSRNDGTHAFSRTLDDHNRAVARFQRGKTRDEP